MTGETLRDLAAGKHALDLRRHGFRTERLEVDIPPNGYANAKAPEFVAESGAVRVTVEAAACAQSFFQGVEKRVQVGSNPWKTVNALPSTKRPAVRRGEVGVEAAGFAIVRRDGGTLRVDDGKTTEVRFTAQPSPAKLTVKCDAPGAKASAAGGATVDKGTALDVPSLQTVEVQAMGEPEDAACRPRPA